MALDSKLGPIPDSHFENDAFERDPAATRRRLGAEADQAVESISRRIRDDRRRKSEAANKEVPKVV